jgi:sec-independent protein translocase protein TatC
VAKIGIVDGPFLRKKNRKYAFLISFIIAAILTPTPDVVNQCLMGIPLVILYEISIVAVWLFGKKRLPGFEEVQGQDDMSNIASPPESDTGEQ